jgi:hypothetical protein
VFDQEFREAKDATPFDEANDIDLVTWKDLVRHFAFGRLYIVRKPWTLPEAARVIKSDDADRLRTALSTGEFSEPSASEAQLWHEQNQTFHVCVLDPFVIASPNEG